MGDAAEQFITRRKDSGGSEQANSQSFLNELCGLLEVDAPAPTRPDDPAPAYAFERQVIFHNGDGTTSTGRIDLYKRGCFVLESKQGTLRKEPPSTLARLAATRAPRRLGVAVRDTRGWDEAMLRAKGQAEGYVRALPAGEGRPPFIVVVDVGHSIELYSEFSMTGGAYIHYPDPQSYRILLEDLRQEGTRDLLRQVWQDPLALDPSRRAAKVTREIAAHLAELAKSLEAAGHQPRDVADFLMRCLFTMFAEDVGLIPDRGFATMLADVQADPVQFKPMVKDLWWQMKSGGYSSYLKKEILHFNGYLFADASALDLDADQVALLSQAAKRDWRDVEPAIFGTLLERALDPVERHKLGAHYTPRAYVERLVMPTIVEPLRAQWDGVKAAVVNLARQGQEAKALAELKAFHRRLCQVRILDPACGTGNFLYVSLEHLKRLEGEVLEMAEKLGHRQRGFDLASGRTVDPHQFLGIEINPRAAAIAELVLWIGYLQWHFRTQGQTNPPEPIIRDFKNIECRDAVLAWDRIQPELDPQTLQPKTRWDGRTFKKSPVTGEDIPDESATVLVEKYINPRKAKWPQADFVVGNPPFMGIAHLRQAVGDGYAETIRKTYADVPGSCDYVLYWWNQAAELARKGKIQRFGLITTNSLRQTLNRRLIEGHLAAKKPLSIIFAVPDHPWVDASDGAAVRISMTVGQGGERYGRLLNVIGERNNGDLGLDVELAEKSGKIQADITVGADIASATALKANELISNRGMQLIGSGFIVTPDQAAALGLGSVAGLEKHIRLYRNGRDLTQTPRQVMAIDLFGLSEEEVRKRYPEVYQWVLERVKPERDLNRDLKPRQFWWLHGRPREELREALNSITRYVATVETAKHRFFVFLDESILPDNMLVNIALDDAYFLGVLSSSLHVTWA
ncbi:MAG: DNA methyltransferase, partial [Pseudomonadota bacterium]